jgi:hypothetical protein
VGKSIPADYTQPKAFAHLLQGWEQRMFKVVHDLYPKSILCPEHDGAITTEELDLDAIRKAIADEFGLDLKIKQRKLD